MPCPFRKQFQILPDVSGLIGNTIDNEIPLSVDRTHSSPKRGAGISVSGQRSHTGGNRFLPACNRPDRMSASDSALLHFTIDHPLLPHALFTQPRQISAVGSGDVCIDIETPHVDFRLGTINILHSSNAITVTLHTTAIEMVNASIHPFSLSGDTEFILMPR